MHGIQAADHDADDHAGHDLQGRMADHLLQMHILQKRRVLFADVDPLFDHCLLYTSDAADEEDSVDLGGRRIIKKKKKPTSA